MDNDIDREEERNEEIRAMQERNQMIAGYIIFGGLLLSTGIIFTLVFTLL